MSAPTTMPVPRLSSDPSATASVPARRSGFTLIEVLFVVGLLGIFAASAAEVFYWSLTVHTRIDHAASALVQVDTILRHLRRDVWSAARVELPDTRTARLHLGDGQVVVWQVTGAQSLSRQGPEQDALGAPSVERAWSAPGMPEAFAPSPTGLTVRLPGRPVAPVEMTGPPRAPAATADHPATTPGSTLALPSQLLILNPGESR